MPLAVRPLCPELAEKARVELFEDPQKLEDGIAHLKEWIAKQPHLHARTDDQWLAAFLRGCKFSLERTKEKMDLYYSMRAFAPELFALKYNDQKFKEILRMGIALVLPKTMKPTDPRVVIIRTGLYDPSKYSIMEVLTVSNVLQQIMLLEDDAFVVSGGINVMDFRQTSLAHFTQMTPVIIKKMIVNTQDAVPIRMKAAHYFYMPSTVETIFNLAKSFMNEKNRKRLYVHGKDFESLGQEVSKDILPVEYGGNGGTIEEIIRYWEKKVEEYSSWLEEDRKFGTDESKRVGKAKSAEDMFGVDGSFRQLAFD